MTGLRVAVVVGRGSALETRSIVPGLGQRTATDPLSRPRRPVSEIAVTAVTLLVVTGLGAVAGPAIAQIPRALIDRAPTVAVTHHVGTFNGETIPYQAIVEEHILRGPDSVPNASLVTISYVRTDVADRARRPVLFAFNGGPGASSSPLHMNGLGPRLGTPQGTAPNPHSVLDATDLIFIDPVGTGFSRPYTTEAGQQFYWTRSGDAASVAEVIGRWLRKYGRELSPRFVAGESYGTTRIGVILSSHPGLRFDGVLLIAFTGLGPNAGREMPYVTALPTMAASAWYHERIDRRGRKVQEVYAEAVEFARTEYLPALVLGWSIAPSAKRELAERMASFIGLPARFIEARHLRISKDDWMLNLLRDRDLRTGMLDTRVTAARDTTRTGGLADPALAGGTLRIGTAMLAPAIVPGTNSTAAGPSRPASALEVYLKRDLQFETLESYRSLNLDLNGIFNHEDRADPGPAIADAMRRHPTMRLFWTAGYYDLTTPAYAAQYALDQVGIPPERTTAVLVPGAHAVFADESNRASLGTQLRAWLR